MKFEDAAKAILEMLDERISELSQKVKNAVLLEPEKLYLEDLIQERHKLASELTGEI